MYRRSPARFALVSAIQNSIVVGGEECLIVITQDVTARQQAEEALHAATAAAEAAQREEEQRRHEAERREQIAVSLRDVLTILNSDRQVTTILEFISQQAGRLLSSDATAIYMTDADVASGGSKPHGSRPQRARRQDHLRSRLLLGFPLRSLLHMGSAV